MHSVAGLPHPVTLTPFPFVILLSQFAVASTYVTQPINPTIATIAYAAGFIIAANPPNIAASLLNKLLINFKSDACHHRLEVLSSFTTSIGIGGTRLGFKSLDSIASIVVTIFL